MPTVEERLTELERSRDAFARQITDIRDTMVQGFGAGHRRMTRIEADIVEIKADIVEMKADIAELKGRLSRVEADVASIKTSVELLHANMADIVTSAVERALDRRLPPRA